MVSLKKINCNHHLNCNHFTIDGHNKFSVSCLMVNTYHCCIKLNVFYHLLSNYNETQQRKWKKKFFLHKPYKRCLANINLYLLKPSLKFCSQQNCNKAAAKFIIQQQLKNLTGKQGGKKREVKKSMHALKAL